MTDREILNACKRGEISSFSNIFHRYWDDLYTLAVQYVKEDDAKDVVQELMIEAWSKHDSLHTDESGSLRGYLFSLLKYRIIDFVNARPNHVFWNDLIPQMAALVESHDLFEDTTVKELQDIINETLAQLRPSELNVFRLRWEQNYSVDDTAKALGISRQSVMNRFNLALKAVRNNINGYYKGEVAAKYQSLLLMLFLSRFF